LNGVATPKERNFFSRLLVISLVQEQSPGSHHFLQTKVMRSQYHHCICGVVPCFTSPLTHFPVCCPLAKQKIEWYWLANTFAAVVLSASEWLCGMAADQKLARAEVRGSFWIALQGFGRSQLHIWK